MGEHKSNTEYLELRRKYVSTGVPLLHPITIVKSHNEIIEDADGNKYIDFTTGIGTTTFGHVNEELLEAAIKQLKELWHICIHITNYPTYLELAKALSERIPISGSKRAAFFNSGAEAVENAIKISRQISHRQYVISFTGGFHGRTYMALTLTGKYKPYKVGFDPFVPGVIQVPYPYCYRWPIKISSCEECGEHVLEYIEHLLEISVPSELVAAIIVEPIQGEGGFIVPPKNFLKGLEKIARDHGIYLIIDEIQTGYCRTGKFMAFEHFNVDPDMVVLGKSIANGLPLSAVVGRDEILGKVVEGSIGGTYTGNPVSTAVAIKVLELIDKYDLCSKAQKLGSIMEKMLKEMADEFDVIGEERGLGVMRAVELVEDKDTKKPAKELTAKVLEEARKRGLLLLKAGYYGNVVRFHPPLTISEENLVKGMEIFRESLKAAIQKSS